MKIIIAVIGLAFFIQTICVFEALGQTDTKPVNCELYNLTTCCNVTGCKLYACSDKDQARCANGTDMKCSNETILQDLCPVKNETESKNDSTSANPSNISTQAPTTTAIPTTSTTNETNTTEPATSKNETATTAGTAAPTTVTAAPTTVTAAPTTGTAAPTTGTAAPTTESVSGVPGSPSSGEESGRHFDAVSFIGGIVLCLGLGVIAFIGLKYYRSRSQQNYRTL